MDKRERAERAKQEDAALNRVLIWIAGAAVLEALLLLLNRYYVAYKASEANIAMGIMGALQVLAIAFPFCFAVCLAWAVMAAKNGKHLKLPKILSIITGILAACILVAWRFPDSGVGILCVLVPVVAVLALIYYLYQREFFLVAAMGAAGLFGVWFIQVRGFRDPWLYAYLALTALCLAAIAILARQLQSKNGVMSIRGKQITVFPANANYVMIYLTCGLVALVLIGMMVLNMIAVSIFYAILVAWMLIMAVYYTVRLM